MCHSRKEEAEATTVSHHITDTPVSSDTLLCFRKREHLMNQIRDQAQEKETLRQEIERLRLELEKIRPLHNGQLPSMLLTGSVDS